jgi:hypothetical protein
LIKHYGFILLPNVKFDIKNFEVNNLPENLILEDNFLVLGNYNDLIKIFINKVKDIV